jgi:hypothetical protein
MTDELKLTEWDIFRTTGPSYSRFLGEDVALALMVSNFKKRIDEFAFEGFLEAPVTLARQIIKDRAGEPEAPGAKNVLKSTAGQIVDHYALVRWVMNDVMEQNELAETLIDPDEARQPAARREIEALVCIAVGLGGWIQSANVSQALKEQREQGRKKGSDGKQIGTIDRWAKLWPEFDNRMPGYVEDVKSGKIQRDRPRETKVLKVIKTKIAKEWWKKCDRWAKGFEEEGGYSIKKLGISKPS